MRPLRYRAIEIVLFAVCASATWAGATRDRVMQTMAMLIAAALIYWALSIGFELVQLRLERRFGQGVAGVGRP